MVHRDVRRRRTCVAIPTPFLTPSSCGSMNQRLKRIYPNIFIFGETWSYNEASQAYFAPNKMYEGHFSLNADAVTDFTLWRAIHKMYSAVEHEQFGWNTGAGELYYRLVSDYLYEKPEDLIIFLDNHDDGRFLGQFSQDTTKLKSALNPSCTPCAGSLYCITEQN